MTDDEAVQAAADAIRAVEASTGGMYDGPSADSIISAHVDGTRALPWSSDRFYRLLRRAARRAGWESSGPRHREPRQAYDPEDFGVPGRDVSARMRQLSRV